MYKLKPDVNTLKEEQVVEEQKIFDKKEKDFVPIIKGLTQLQQHAKKVNQIKQYQEEIMDISNSKSKSVILLDSKLQKISTSPTRVVSVHPDDLDKQGRTGMTMNQATWLKKRGFQWIYSKKNDREEGIKLFQFIDFNGAGFVTKAAISTFLHFLETEVFSNKDFVTTNLIYIKLKNLLSMPWDKLMQDDFINLIVGRLQGDSNFEDQIRVKKQKNADPKRAKLVNGKIIGDTGDMILVEKEDKEFRSSYNELMEIEYDNKKKMDEISIKIK